jgi:phage terminase large subunit GpA-like protein
VIKKYSPPERLTVSQWASKYRILSPESSAAPGRWHNDRTPYLAEIMDCANNRNVREIVVMSSSQVGKTESLLNLKGYFIDLDPCPVLCLQPTIQLAEDYSKDRIAPMIRDCARLRGKVGDAKARDGTNTLLHKIFPGGHLTLSGSNSPASLASRPIRVLLIDEVDRMETTAEGDPISLVEKRTITFYNRLVVKVSTPTIQGLSRIERAYLRSDQRHFLVACPRCAHDQKLVWGQVAWEKDADGEHHADTARYTCEKCGKPWTDSERYAAIGKGHWQASEAFRGVAGFHLNELYSLWRKLSEVVQDFLDKKDNPDTLRVWVNTSLGESFRLTGKAPEWQKLYDRREQYQIGTIPAGGIFLTGGADVQEDRIHVEIVAWGRNFETWSVAYLVLYGDTAALEVWQQLDKVVQSIWQKADGNKIGISKFAIDAGFNTTHVHNWARVYPASKVIPVVGRDTQKSVVSVPHKMDLKNGKGKTHGLKSYPVGSAVVKQEFYGFLRQLPPGPEQGYPFGYCHFPNYDENFFKELTAEEVHKELRHGFPVLIWKKIRERNEALDCRVYARAAAFVLGIDRYSEEDWCRIENDYPGPIQKRLVNAPIERESLAEESIWRE